MNAEELLIIAHRETEATLRILQRVVNGEKVPARDLWDHSLAAWCACSELYNTACGTNAPERKP